jgi:hypothetical protein
MLRWPTMLLLLASILCVAEGLKVHSLSQKCEDGQFYNKMSEKCQTCSECKPPLVKAAGCGTNEIGFDSDTVCCHHFQYPLFGECVLNCDYCEGYHKCVSGKTICDCPKDRTGYLCDIPKISAKTSISNSQTKN